MKARTPKAIDCRFCTVQAVCYLRPTRENIARIRRELRDPRYGEYNLCEWLVARLSPETVSRSLVPVV